MVIQNTGRMFLDAYNEKYGTSYSARDFFAKVFYPLFFNHNKYMMTGGNSPLENGGGCKRLSWDNYLKKNLPYETPQMRRKRYENFMRKIDEGKIDSSMTIDNPNPDVASIVSGEVTNMPLAEYDKEEILLSWVGYALSVGVGDLNILFCDKDIAMDVFEGWQYYRDFLEKTELLRGNQVNTWNGQWLNAKFGGSLTKAPVILDETTSYVDKGSGIIRLRSLSWTKILIALSRKYGDRKILGYVYKTSQNTFTTIGYMPFDLSQIRKPVDLYQKFFGIGEGKKAESLWGTRNGFNIACMEGTIGLKAMQPRLAKKYIDKDGMPKIVKDDEQRINYNVLKIWILSMMENEELWPASEKLKGILLSAKSDKKLTSKATNAVAKVLKANDKQGFMEALTELVPYIKEHAELLAIAKNVNDMPDKDIKYFMTLVRLQFASNN